MIGGTTGLRRRALVALGLGAMPAIFGCSSDSVYVLGHLPSGGEGGRAARDANGPDVSGFWDAAAVSDVFNGSDAVAVSDASTETPRTDASTSDGAQPCSPPDPVRDYVFDGVGTEIVDRGGGPSGQIRGGATLDGSGELALDGVDDYVDLPSGILTGLDEVTVLVWIRYRGGAAYTRIFDFGVGSDGEDPAEGLGTIGTTYLSLTPMTGFVPPHLAALISRDGAAGEIALVTDTRLDEELHLMAVTVASTTLELFYDAALIGRIPSSVPLSSIEDVNNWLGRSQYDQDPYLHAGYAGLRLFDHALPQCAIRSLYELGPRG